MYFLKKCGIYLIVLLLIVSIYKDLSSESNLITDNKNFADIESTSQHFKVVKVKVQSGDTVLSIMEEINKNIGMKLDMNNLLADFKTINDVDPHELKIGHYYYFPLYR